MTWWADFGAAEDEIYVVVVFGRVVKSYVLFPFINLLWSCETS